ncbi:hypothetical protein DWU99_10300 [Dyella psychrodurans]|uniref:Uncharacterized protein n=1 Tax=Dyella psychrodurans TaxID=1927960 RepID=A0A370X6S3_9GAMM|nr:hypothetical protein DWU99_10300 [Dyella psychrodurans]
MLGWWITINRASDPRETKVASWEASLGGDDWPNHLVECGQASQVQFNGYPNRYEARAANVIPVIEHGPPPHAGPMVIGDDYVSDGGWSRDFTLNADVASRCSPDEVLIIDVWDQS